MAKSIVFEITYTAKKFCWYAKVPCSASVHVATRGHQRMSTSITFPSSFSMLMIGELVMNH